MNTSYRCIAKGEGGCQKRTFADVGEGGLGECRRPQNVGDFLQNSM